MLHLKQIADADILSSHNLTRKIKHIPVIKIDLMNPDIAKHHAFDTLIYIGDRQLLGNTGAKDDAERMFRQPKVLGTAAAVDPNKIPRFQLARREQSFMVHLSRDRDAAKIELIALRQIDLSGIQHLVRSRMDPNGSLADPNDHTACFLNDVKARIENLFNTKNIRIATRVAAGDGAAVVDAQHVAQ